MTTSSKRKVVPARKSSPVARKPLPRAVATSVRTASSLLRKSKPAVKVRAAAGQRLLLSGQSRAELRTLGVALAAEADRDLYCVDLSHVAGKYIGETEKNLDRVFAVAEATGAVLFFDEADALFGKRTTVKDSHDRYANQEVSYLLERIEAYPGLVVLTANNRKNLDEAFLRRLRFTSVEQVPMRRKSA